MTKATSSKKTHRRTCKNPSCKAKFTTPDSRKLFCKPECQARKHITSKRKSTYAIPKTNHFLIYIAKEVERAGTLHVLDPLVGNCDALMALYDVVRTRLVANVLTGSKVSQEGKRSDPFHASHIAPVKHDHILGMLCAENLIVLPAKLNRSYANNHSNGAGVFMYRCDMQLCNSILAIDSDILERAIAYIGLDTVTAFCRKAKLAPSQRATALKQLSSIVDHADESHAQFIALLKDPKATTPQLVAAIETIQCKAQFKPLMRGTKLSESAMLIQELIRHAQYNPELEDYAAISRTFTKNGFHHNTLSAESQLTLSRLLHGHSEIEMPDEVKDFLYDLRQPVRVADDEAKQIEQRHADERAAKARHIAYIQSPAGQWDWARLEADFMDMADYCNIPYMLPPVVLNLVKTRIVPESGSMLPNGDVAF